MFVSNAQVTVEIELDLTGHIDPAEPHDAGLSRLRCAGAGYRR